jgi:hypothetical protein
MNIDHTEDSMTGCRAYFPLFADAFAASLPPRQEEERKTESIVVSRAR